MKQFEYQKYDYSFLYGLLTKKQQEEVQGLLNRFIGKPNTEQTRFELKTLLENWMIVNNIDVNGKFKLEINYE